MTTQTPTSNLPGNAPANFPDEATLANLASEMFARASGIVAAVKPNLPSGPTLPTAAAPAIQSPTAAPFSPEHPAATSNAPIGTPVTVSAANATVPPEAPPLSTPAAAPFYFLRDKAGPSVPQSLPGGVQSSTPSSAGSFAGPQGHVPFSPSNRSPANAGVATGVPVSAPTGIAPHLVAPFEVPNFGAQDPFVTALATPLYDNKPQHTHEPAYANLGQPKPDATQPQWFYFADGLNKNGKSPSLVGSGAGLDVVAVRRDFPILAERVNGKPLIWFDNAATTQKPQAVIDRIAYFYAHENSNIHRAAHALAARATDAYEAAREKVRRFLGAAQTEEIIFVRGATEAINLVANTWGRENIGPGDEIIVSNLEHHANIVPWQMLAQEKGAKLKVIPVDDTGQLRLDALKQLLTDRTKLVSVTQVSNALGTVTPINEVVALAHAAGAKVLVDGAQAVSHMRVNVQTIDADFYVFSGHKVFGPTGIGVVYGKRAILDNMKPWQGGGNMIADVTFEHTQYQGAPLRFEAGTGNIADAVGLGAAIDYVERIGMDNINAYEHQLLDYAHGRLQEVPGLRLIGTAANKASVASFVLEGFKTDEVGHALNEDGIAVRTGHHCAQPILRRFGQETLVRPSLAFYNTCGEIDSMIVTLQKLVRQRAPFKG